MSHTGVKMIESLDSLVFLSTLNKEIKIIIILLDLAQHGNGKGVATHKRSLEFIIFPHFHSEKFEYH